MSHYRGALLDRVRRRKVFTSSSEKGDNQNTKRIECGAVEARGEKNGELIAREEEMRAQGFPAIMGPEPVGWGATNLFFEQAVNLGGEKFGVIGFGINRFRDGHFPPRPAAGVDGNRDQRKTGAKGKPGRDHRGGSEPPKKWRPESGITGALIGQDTDDAALAQKRTI